MRVRVRVRVRVRMYYRSTGGVTAGDAEQILDIPTGMRQRIRMKKADILQQ